MLRIGNFRAWISVDDEELKELKEYDVKINVKDKTATCWVASDVGKVRRRTFFSSLVAHNRCNFEVLGVLGEYPPDVISCRRCTLFGRVGV